MTAAMHRKTLVSVRDGLKSGAMAAARSASRQARRIRSGRPLVRRKPMIPSHGPKPWLVGLMVFSSAVAFVGGLLYYRKRKQIADRYTMGKGEKPASPVP